MDDEPWVSWLKTTTGAESARDIAKHLNRSHTTVLRWMREGCSPARVIDLARTLDADVVDALVAAGCIDRSEVRSRTAGEVLESSPTAALTAELHRRAVDGTFVFQSEPQNGGQPVR